MDGTPRIGPLSSLNLRRPLFCPALVAFVLLLGLGRFTSVRADAVTLGIALSQLANRVDQFIQEAAAAGQMLELQAGSEVLFTIDQAKVAYDDSLKKSVAEIDTAAAQNLQRLQTIVQTLELGMGDHARDVGDRAQQLVNSLPFPPHFPQLRAYSPKVFVSGPGTARVELRGNFPDSARQGYEPRLRLDHHESRLIELSTLSATFELQRGVFSAPSGPLAVHSAQLLFPYSERFMGVFKRRKEAAFRILLGVVPASPGRITLRWTEQHGGPPERRPEREPPTGSFWQSSWADDLTNNYCGRAADVGWKIDAASVRLVTDQIVEGHLGAEIFYTKFSDVPAPCFQVRTVYHRIGDSGKVHFHIEWQEFRETMSETAHELPVSLTWGDSRAFTVPPASWRVEFDSFDGHHHDYAGPFTDRFLRVGVTGNSVMLAAPSEGEIVP